MDHFSLLLADALLPIRVLAMSAFLAVIVAFFYVLRHLQQVERAIRANNLIPAQRGPRNNVTLIIARYLLW